MDQFSQFGRFLQLSRSLIIRRCFNVGFCHTMSIRVDWCLINFATRFAIITN